METDTAPGPALFVGGTLLVTLIAGRPLDAAAPAASA